MCFQNQRVDSVGGGFLSLCLKTKNITVSTLMVQSPSSRHITCQAVVQ